MNTTISSTIVTRSEYKAINAALYREAGITLKGERSRMGAVEIITDALFEACYATFGGSMSAMYAPHTHSEDYSELMTWVARTEEEIYLASRTA